MYYMCMTLIESETKLTLGKRLRKPWAILEALAKIGDPENRQKLIMLIEKGKATEAEK